uniref:Uncharacterized protein n=1 Tax=Avena sativa TaxID=4498 RepID=A0ACD5VYD2_AVESA
MRRMQSVCGGAGWWWRAVAWWGAVVLGHLVTRGSAGLLDTNPGLAYNFYRTSCPSAEATVKTITSQQVAANPALAGRLLRLHFHDCFVQGCDASILLDTTTPPNEKSAGPNGSVGGYEVIDAIKTQLEKTCPGVVSCADIIALAARDAVSYQFPSSLWQVETGRRDGPSSLASNTGALPSFSAGFNALVQSFAAQGLDVGDLVALSGAHTIGKASCSSVTPRLYQGNATNVDPLLDPTLATVLMSKCPNNPSSSSSTVDLDGNTPLKFDGTYYTNLQNKRGLLASDAALMQNAAAVTIVNDLTNPYKFYAAFSMSMKKMGRINVLTTKNNKGKIRAQCRAP